METKVVCGAEVANGIFQEFHASVTGAHCGQTKTRDAISKRFDRPGVSVDTTGYISTTYTNHNYQAITMIRLVILLNVKVL